ncbi:LLM class flavin-dependent oxidoreductase [Mesorhizobium sp. 1B3]|uniref:LLM class flavin-dependent oxidoreductase n=1 Tax=Mesorhizobium sp. 1B3 TaxID=3243599 RepID=UPI003D96CE71
MTIQFVADACIPAVHGSADARRLRDFAAAAEQNGFDEVALPFGIQGQDAILLASYILHSTAELRVAAAHEAGLVAPEIAARQIAALDRLSGGRLTIAVAENGTQNHEERQGRLDEYLVLLKRLWANDVPFDHEGRYYRVAGAFTTAKPCRDGRVPIMLRGLSGLAIKVAARHADIFALPSSTVAGAGLTVERVRRTAANHGRASAIQFSYPLRAAIGRNKAEARAKAGPGRGASAATLVAGTPEQVALAILDYHAIGVSHLVMHGFATGEEVAAFGRQVIPLIRNADRHRSRHTGDLAAMSLPPPRDLPRRAS